MLEVESTDALVLVQSDGTVWSIFENSECSMVARLASKEKYPNLISGQIVQLSQRQLLNTRPDKASEIYSYSDKKLKLVGQEKMKLASIA